MRCAAQLLLAAALVASALILADALKDLNRSIQDFLTLAFGPH
jgi:hypothetical protein